MPRQELPTTRESRTITIQHIWAPGSSSEYAEQFDISFSCMPNGENIAEVFYNPSQLGEQQNERILQFRQDACILVSMMLQWGVPLKTIRDGVSHVAVNRMGEIVVMPATIIGAILDALAREQGLPPAELPADLLEQADALP